MHHPRRQVRWMCGASSVRTVDREPTKKTVDGAGADSSEDSVDRPDRRMVAGTTHLISACDSVLQAAMGLNFLGWEAPVGNNFHPPATP